MFSVLGINSLVPMAADNTSQDVELQHLRRREPTNGSSRNVVAPSSSNANGFAEGSHDCARLYPVETHLFNIAPEEGDDNADYARYASSSSDVTSQY